MCRTKAERLTVGIDLSADFTVPKAYHGKHFSDPKWYHASPNNEGEATDRLIMRFHGH
ncbi:hypothetical protein HALO156_190088 [Halomonas sp. 156]|nr:hypothetical protein HALO156_190088 [Halomonas sp. 156]